MFNYKILATATFIFLSACTTQPTIPVDAIPSSKNSAVLNLLESAQGDLNNKLYTVAESKLERALRIEPQNANIWYGLAKIAYKQNNFSEAENIANRALSYVSPNSPIEKSIIRLLEEIQSR